MLRIFRAKPVASQSTTSQGRATPPAWRGAVVLMIVPGTLVATIAFSCNNKDSIYITDPNATGGSSGAAGNAGSGGSGGNGGSGMAGAAGSSTGGTAGAGGSSGAGGSAGMAGSAGSAGTGGSVNDPDAGDGGPDPDSGGPPPEPLTQAQAVTAICARLDEVASCAPLDGCTDIYNGQWDFYNASYPNCAAITDAWFQCLAAEPVTSYYCDNDSPLPLVPQTGACADEETAFGEVSAATAPCTQP
jgi:hypothetical protein